ncbi:hypothetical protein [uncultured Arthrobacter sp.]|uniref:hypothetical protein n=1 Tax=uncultured Arthrobacter sp. TaxID=114050 RepID=UPI0026245B2C|nr:hypothetical protein [uncultured Arthrobacter sp.]
MGRFNGFPILSAYRQCLGRTWQDGGMGKPKAVVIASVPATLPSSDRSGQE